MDIKPIEWEPLTDTHLQKASKEWDAFINSLGISAKLLQPSSLDVKIYNPETFLKRVQIITQRPRYQTIPLTHIPLIERDAEGRYSNAVFNPTGYAVLKSGKFAAKLATSSAGFTGDINGGYTTEPIVRDWIVRWDKVFKVPGELFNFSTGNPYQLIASERWAITTYEMPIVNSYQHITHTGFMFSLNDLTPYRP